jgi:Protein of unknown function (DUF1549)/Protein of unknown function (DUF1553)
MKRPLKLLRAVFFAGVLLGVAPGTRAGTNHWAYEPLRVVEPPRPNGAAEANPVDAFLLQCMAAAGLQPAGEADRRTLLRRVTYDLAGLPPTPEEITAFLSDPAPGAYERVVDRLLASPRYGERWARHWMDTAHFAETHGNDQDRIRTNAWPYRDYLIEAFNADTPYARFIQEQVAGDVLFPEFPSATAALGFIAAGPWDESSLRDIREDTLDRQIARYVDRDDMVSTVMNSVMSTTVQCARCHDHKFDPVPMRDYYALQAVFAGVDRANRAFDRDPNVQRRRRELAELRRRLDQNDISLLEAPQTLKRLREWSAANAAHPVAWTVVNPSTYTSAHGSALRRQPDGSFLAGGANPEKEAYTVTLVGPLRRVTAIRVEAMADPSLPQQGPGRAENGNFHLTDVEVLAFDSVDGSSRTVKIRRATADFNQAGWGVETAFDGDPATGWGVHPQEGASHTAVFELAEPLVLERGSAAIVLRQDHGAAHVIGRFRLSITDAQGPVRMLPAEIEEALAAGGAAGSAPARRKLAAFVLREDLEKAAAALPPPSLVYAAAAEFEPDGGFKPAGGPRKVHILRRGEITKPGDEAVPGALTCVAGLDAKFDLADLSDEGSRRAALARWLTARDNAPAWRSIVNRVWAWHFGKGIVETPNDFGKMGGLPSHPELLDWLAAWFRDDAGGSFKALHRLLVTSAAYRREAGAPPPNDSDNRLLSHMNRLRLDAECVHDAILQVSGRIDWRMGGPSDRQFDLQPGIHVTPKVDYAKFDVDSDAGNRRSVYRFLFRSLPDPFMEALDCPAGDQLAGARVNSVTVQQALALWNSAFVVRQSAHFAERLHAAARDDDRRISLACELAWGRGPDAAEQRTLADYAARHGLENLCRLLFNSNEFVFVN